PIRAAAGAAPAGSPFEHSVSFWRLDAVRVEQAFADGSVVPFFRFRAMRGVRSNGALPLLDAPEGSTVILRIRNRLPVAIKPLLV
ncbi:MAG: hypothetical protein GWN84_06075, partial [Gammaproteobacteria bacterium]|nr:hypothetical protein [Gammaproteobacteria bacterium]NIR82503.1 hypothetical protein [Gammaproteobacteria bacterium]NIV50991.1 hypothetical protein [Gammaproteobacteria bacterium]